jgi:cytochrome c553
MLNKNPFVAVIFCLTLLVGSALAGGDLTRGADIAEECANCHGDDGKGDEDFPGIAGQDAAILVTFLKAFKSGERTSEDDVMQEYTADLSDQDMADVAAYFASLPGN